MIDALLKGKLSQSQENMEDILTSTVFGILKDVAPKEGLLRWLATAETTKGAHPLSQIPSSSSLRTIDFWPRWSEPDCVACEPDLVLRIDGGGSGKWIIGVEAKYQSGKSSEADSEQGRPPNDQLAKEWDNLWRISARDETPVLIYLTKDYTIPRDDIASSINDFRDCGKPGSPAPTIYWLTWRMLPTLFRNAPRPLTDLAQLMERLNLVFFEGITIDQLPPNLDWSFESSPPRETLQEFVWTFDITNEPPTWRFTS